MKNLFKKKRIGFLIPFYIVFNMKLRLSLGDRSTNAKPFKIQYKRFLFWHDFNGYIEGTDGWIKEALYYSLEEGKAQIEMLAEGLSKKTKTI